MAFTRGQLKLAFTWHIAREIVEGDIHIADEEEAWLERTFPRQTLVEAGFLGPDGQPSVDYESALGEALVSLPDLLSLDEKLAMITTLFEGTLVDAHFHHEEGNVLVKAAQLLGIGSKALDAHLASLDAVGEVELDEAVDESP